MSARVAFHGISIVFSTTDDEVKYEIDEDGLKLRFHNFSGEIALVKRHAKQASVQSPETSIHTPALSDTTTPSLPKKRNSRATLATNKHSHNVHFCMPNSPDTTGDSVLDEHRDTPTSPVAAWVTDQAAELRATDQHQLSPAAHKPQTISTNSVLTAVNPVTTPPPAQPAKQHKRKPTRNARSTKRNRGAASSVTSTAQRTIEAFACRVLNGAGTSSSITDEVTHQPGGARGSAVNSANSKSTTQTQQGADDQDGSDSVDGTSDVGSVASGGEHESSVREQATRAPANGVASVDVAEDVLEDAPGGLGTEISYAQADLSQESIPFDSQPGMLGSQPRPESPATSELVPSQPAKATQTSTSGSTVPACMISTKPLPGLVPASDAIRAASSPSSIQLLQCTGPAPTPRWGHQAGRIKPNVLLIYGGSDIGTGACGDTYALDTVRQQWEEVTSVSTIQRAWGGLATLDNGDEVTLLAYGGEQDGKADQPERISKTMILDSDSMVWYPPATQGVSPPPPRSGHSLEAVGSRVVVFGGQRGRKWLDEVFMYDVERFAWEHGVTHAPRKLGQREIMGDAPSGRSFHSCTAVGDKLVVFGGNDEERCFNDVHVLDVSQDTWAWLQPVIVGTPPSRRCGHSATAVSGRHIVIYGGWDPQEDTDATPVYSDCFVLDTEAWEWTTLPVQLPAGTDASHFARCGHVASLVQVAVNSNASNGIGSGNGSAGCVAGASGPSEVKLLVHGGVDGEKDRCDDCFVVSLPCGLLQA